MRRLVVSIAMLALGLGVYAQSGTGAVFEKEYHLFDFSVNASRLEMGLNFGQAGSFTDYARFGMGANLLVNGFYVDFIKTEAQHKYDGKIKDTQYNDNEAISINVGYQFPVLGWLRIMPLLGYAQTNDGITDGSSLELDAGDEVSSSWYHRYEVTPGSRTHYFCFGGGVSIQPCKWFSINLIATTHAIYGGIAFNALAFAGR